MNNQPTIYLDMDGVCCDFQGDFLRLAGYDDQAVRDVLDLWPRDYPLEWDMHHIMGIERWEFDELLDNAGAAFWSDMTMFSTFHWLYGELRDLAPVIFLSTPWDANSSAGKVMWLQKCFGDSFDEYVLTKHKSLLARSDALLIDDSIKNCQDFVMSGGRAHLFRQPWNITVDEIDLVSRNIFNAVHVARGWLLDLRGEK